MEECNFECLLKGFEKRCTAIHKSSLSNLPKGLIYHYTSFAGLKGILEKKKIRYTDYRYLNDPSELLYSKQLIKNAILNSNIQNHYLISLVFKILDDLDKYCNIYISSFSEKEKLALWRYYASNGTGFAIGLKQDFIKIDPQGEIGKSCLYNVIYGEEKAKEEINKFIRCCSEILGQFDNSNKDFVKKLASKFLSHLISLLPVFKDESFKDEEEIRLVHIEGSISE